VRCPVRELSSPRVVQSASRPVHELAIRELSSNLHYYELAKQHNGGKLVICSPQFMTRFQIQAVTGQHGQ